MTYLLSSYREDPAAYNLIKASLLQKLIRRGMVKEANYIAQLYINDNQSKGLRRRLQIIAAEDIGFGWPESVLYFNQQEDLIKITSALAQAQKNREADRFLLAVANDYSSLMSRDESIRKESSSLKYLFKLSSKWFESKKREDLNELKDAFSRLAKLSKLPDVIEQLGENYIELTRGKIHGARCQMALAVLLAIRGVEKTGWTPDESLIKQQPFDEIFDFAIDMHTPIGKKLKRDFNHWVNNCVVVSPELIYDSLYDSNGDEKYPLTDRSNKKGS